MMAECMVEKSVVLRVNDGTERETTVRGCKLVMHPCDCVNAVTYPEGNLLEFDPN